MEYETKIKLFVADSPTEWIRGAIVCLYDRDRISRDDHLGTEVTDMYGEATIRFSSEQFLDLDEYLGGRLPDLFVRVYDAEGTCVISTRTAAKPRTVPELIRVPIERELARKHRLI